MFYNIIIGQHVYLANIRVPLLLVHLCHCDRKYSGLNRNVVFYFNLLIFASTQLDCLFYQYKSNAAQLTSTKFTFTILYGCSVWQSVECLLPLDTELYKPNFKNCFDSFSCFNSIVLMKNNIKQFNEKLFLFFFYIQGVCFFISDVLCRVDSRRHCKHICRFMTKNENSLERSSQPDSA